MKCATSSKGKEKSRRLTRKKPIRKGEKRGHFRGKRQVRGKNRNVRYGRKITCILYNFEEFFWGWGGRGVKREG